MIKLDLTEIENITRCRVDNGILPGAVMGINIKGERAYNFMYGYSDVTNKTPIKSDNLFRLASMTKPITVCAILILADRNLLNVTDKVSKYIPAFSKMYVGEVVNGEVVKKCLAQREITIQDILTHSSGLGSGEVGNLQYQKFGHKNYDTLMQLVNGYSNMLLDFSPGTSQLYSGVTALDICARIVEIVSGLNYEQFLKQNIFEPLNMVDTGYKLSEQQYKRLVPMYRLSDDVKNIQPSNFGNLGFQNFKEGAVSGAAGLIGSYNDYINFATMLSLNGNFNGKQIVSEALIAKMRKPYFKVGFAGVNEYFNWGYGVRVVSKFTDKMQMLPSGSYGWSGAYNTHFWIDPKNKIAAVYLSNLDNAGGAGAITAFEFECAVYRALNYTE